MSDVTRGGYKSIGLGFQCGALSAAVAGTVTYPFRPAFPNSIHLSHHVPTGVFRHWSGNFANLFIFVPLWSFNFGLREIAMLGLPPLKRDDSTSYKLLVNTLGGALAGVASQLFIYPIDNARIRSIAVSNNTILQYVGMN